MFVRLGIRVRRIGMLAAAALVVGAGLALPVSAAATADSTSTVVGCATLGSGSTGQAVKTIQRVLGTSVDGDFGPMTQAALKTWQKSVGVARTGIVDAATWAALPAAVGKQACSQRVAGTGVATSCATLFTGSTGLAVDVLQAALDLPVTGTFGPATQHAVKLAQANAGLPVTGITTRKTWGLLHLLNTPACAAQTGSTTSSPSDQAAQAKIRARVVRLAAKLITRPGLTTNPITEQAIAFETKQIGKPYLWGGIGPKSYDCSGLQMTSYLHAGLTIPRTAAEQYAGAGTPVPLDQAQQGDLLFFASDVTQPSTVYHVAMYDGNGQVLDSPHTGAFVGLQPLRTTDLLPMAIRPVASLVLPLRAGATGYTVTQLQLNLNRHGADLPVDGSFGATTVAAVKSWQRAHSLAANGVVNQATWLSFG